MSKNWYYGSKEHKQGPVSSEELKALVHKGSLPRETLVCEEGSENWQPIEDLQEVFMQTDTDVPEPEARGDKDEPCINEKSSSKVHPWHRFWARMLDYIVFIFVVRLIFSAIPTPFFFFYPPSMFVILIFLFCFIEAAMICSWTSTIGKSLFGIYVRKKDGSKLNYREAICRSLSVWWLGLGAGLPIVILVTMIVACVKLSNNYITTWDRKGDIVVEHRPLKPGRIVGIVIIYVLLSYVLFPYFNMTSVWVEPVSKIVT
ncbi:MAG: hypothetical protein S4CHLAM37_10650 [Chlamydiia bacterium]|nr:hypothetical protein [Chlamydiia bacterium]